MSIDFVGASGVGSNLIGRFVSLDDNGQLNDITSSGIVTNIISAGFSEALSTCEQAFLASQSVKVNCDNTKIGELVRNGKNCEFCLTNVALLMVDRDKLEKQAASLNSSYTPQTVSTNVLRDINGSSGDMSTGICRYVCQQCVVENISQELVLNISSDCRVNTTDFRTAFTNAMTNHAANYISQHKDSLNQTGADIQSQLDVDRLSIAMSNTISNMTTNSTLQSLQTAGVAIQEMTIASGSTSLVVDNVSQSMSVTQFNSVTSSIFTDTRIRNSIDYDILQKQIELETNFTELVRSLTNTAESLQDILSSSMGKIVAILIGLLLTVGIIIVSLFVIKPEIIFGKGKQNHV